MPKPLEERPFVVDHIIVVCKTCGSERKLVIDPPFRSAKEFITWEKQKTIPRCSCGAHTCDLQLHIADEN